MTYVTATLIGIIIVFAFNIAEFLHRTENKGVQTDETLALLI
jgi:hypothetical protein